MSLRITLAAWSAALLLIIGFHAAESETSSDEQALKDAKLSTDGPELVKYFEKMTLTDADADKIKKLIDQLGDDDFDVREKATTLLKGRGPVALPFLRAVVNSKDENKDLERVQ